MSITAFDHVMSADEARRLTERIRLTAHNYTEAREKLVELVEDAKTGSAHVALGYASWTAYLAEVLGQEPLRLARDDRQDLVRVLSAEGMSTRAIAPIVGAGVMTVSDDLRDVRNRTPAVPSSADAATGEIHNQPVTGMDGKRYARPETKPATEYTPRAEPIINQFSAAITDLNRLLDRFHQISTNRNFTNNKSQIATLHGSDLARAISELEHLLAELTN